MIAYIQVAVWLAGPCHMLEEVAERIARINSGVDDRSAADTVNVGWLFVSSRFVQ